MHRLLRTLLIFDALWIVDLSFLKTMKCQRLVDFLCKQDPAVLISTNYVFVKKKNQMLFFFPFNPDCIPIIEQQLNALSWV